MSEEKIFRFENLNLLTDENIKILCRSMDMSFIVAALIDAPKDIVEKFMRVLPPQSAQMLKKEIVSTSIDGDSEYSGAVTPIEGRINVLRCLSHHEPRKEPHPSDISLPNGFRYMNLQDLYDEAEISDGITNREPFVFEDFSEMRIEHIKRVIALVGHKPLRSALHFASQETRVRFCEALSEDETARLKKIIFKKNYSDFYDRRKCLQAQNRYVWAALMLERQGTVEIPAQR